MRGASYLTLFSYERDLYSPVVLYSIKEEIETKSEKSGTTYTSKSGEFLMAKGIPRGLLWCVFYINITF